ncbi:MAG: HNH endonuclease [Bacteroidaceae bacterium]|nr:HNH endonuclease [Bacteroidaceae bacterium]
MEQSLLDVYSEVRECDYKGEHYSVRDNGAIMRHPNGVRKRPTDGVWTFGTKDKNGYMITSGVRVHIVVATAFHGTHDSTKLVVDHIDTNRSNNRPENLRWLTKLENILLNEFTKAKIEYICGSVENFLANPDILRGHESEDPNFQWMRTVTKEEAANTLIHMKQLIARPKDTIPTGRKMDERVYMTPQQRKEESLRKAMMPSQVEIQYRQQRYEELENEKMPIEPFFSTDRPLAVQMGWSPFTKPDFPCCPDSVSDQPLQDYLKRLQKGKDFVIASYGKSIVHECTIYKDKLLVVTKILEGVKDFGLTEIIWNGKQFVHLSKGTFFEENGVMASYFQAQDKEWDGPDSIDFYC